MADDDTHVQYYNSLLQRLSAIEGRTRTLEFELETQTSIVNLLQETCEKHSKKIQEKEHDLKVLQEKYSKSAESLKLQEETQKGLEASLRSEAAAHHSLKNDLHTTVSTHKQLTSARNKTTFEKRSRISALLGEHGVAGSTELSSSTDADVCAAGDHPIAKGHKQLDAEIASLLKCHSLFSAFGDTDESRLRLVYSCMRDVQRLVEMGVMCYDSMAQFVKSRINGAEAKTDSVDFLLSVVETTLNNWVPDTDKELAPKEVALLKAAAIKETMLANRKWYCEPQPVLYGSAGLSQGKNEK